MFFAEQKAQSNRKSRIENRKNTNFDCGLISIFYFQPVFFGRAKIIMAFLFEKLDVYQKAMNFAERIHLLAESFPKGHSHIAGQLNRTSLSISANIAEV